MRLQSIFRFILLLLLGILTNCAAKRPDNRSHKVAQSPERQLAESFSGASTNVTSADPPVFVTKRSKVSADSIAIIYNLQDPTSVEIADYYKSARNIPPSNVIGVSFTPNQADMSMNEFERIYGEVETALQNFASINAFAIAWSTPYRVHDCASITSAFAIGPAFENFCAASRNCASAVNLVHYDSDSFDLSGYRPSMVIHAGTVALSKTMIDRGVAADSLDLMTSGAGAVGVFTEDFVRSFPRDESLTYLARFATYGAQLSYQYADMRFSPRPVPAPGYITGRANLLFYFTGLEIVPATETNTYLPGAVGDHLTSYGGYLDSVGGQMTAIDWIKSGVTGSYGTVLEPCPFRQKFPDPAVMVRRYMSGETMVEAYWKSVRAPLEGVFVGEPLARPGKLTESFTYDANGVTLKTNAMEIGVNRLMEANSSSGPFTEIARYNQTVLGQATLSTSTSPLGKFYRFDPPQYLDRIISSIRLGTVSVGPLSPVNTSHVTVQTVNWGHTRLAGFEITHNSHLTCRLPEVRDSYGDIVPTTCSNCEATPPDPENIISVFQFARPYTEIETFSVRFPCYADTGFNIIFIPGDHDGDTRVTYFDQSLLSYPMEAAISKAEYVAAYDLNEDLALNSADLTLLVAQTMKAKVSKARVFYNRSPSSVFGNGTGNPLGSIDPTRRILRPGESPTSKSYSNYSKGINGLLIDTVGPLSNATRSDFTFEVWNGITGAGFTHSTATATVTVLPDAGDFIGGTRIKVTFSDNAVQNTWLKMTLNPTGNTMLAHPEVFYFGNAIADIYAGNVGSPTIVRVNATDTSLVRQNQSTAQNSVSVNNIYDVNKDGRVNATDTSIVRQNQNNAVLKYLP